jgi:glycosyltransferase involved in cell wall biosynthesis
MKALHVVPSVFSGAASLSPVEQTAFDIIRAMDCAGRADDCAVESALLAFGGRSDAFLLDDGVACSAIPGDPADPFTVPSPQLMEKIDWADVVLVHRCLTVMGLFLASRAKLAGKIVLGLHDGGGESILAPHTPEATRMFDFFVAQSKFAAAALFPGVGAPVKVILGPVDSERWRPQEAKPDASLSMCAGPVLPESGFDRVVKALPEALRLAIVGVSGSKDYLAYLRSLIEKSKRDVSLTLDPSPRDVLALLGRAGLFVQASTYFDYENVYHPRPELNGRPPLQALSCGVPAIVSAAGCLPELRALPGCKVFSSDAELAALLDAHGLGSSKASGPQEMHAAVAEAYGARQFGRKLLAELSAARSAA